ncbi:MAG: hypothetical protein AAF152_19280, partial [Cyanobacteria bacterium P01_A01_bin.114]
MSTYDPAAISSPIGKADAVDATLISSESLETSAASASATTSETVGWGQILGQQPRMSPFLRILGVSTLTGAALTTMTRPVFWLDANYLYEANADREVSERFSPIPISSGLVEPASAELTNLVIPPLETPNFAPALNPKSAAIAQAPLEPDSASRLTLQRTQGFSPPTQGISTTIDLPPVPPPAVSSLAEASPILPSGTSSDNSSGSQTTGAPTPVDSTPSPTLPPLDLTAVLVPPQPVTASPGEPIPLPETLTAIAPTVTPSITPSIPPSIRPTPTLSTLAPNAAASSTAPTRVASEPRTAAPVLPWADATPEASETILTETASTEILPAEISPAEISPAEATLEPILPLSVPVPEFSLPQEIFSTLPNLNQTP